MESTEAKGRTLETTLGDLILALTEETTRVVRDEREACKIVAVMLIDILNSSAPASKSLQ